MSQQTQSIHRQQHLLLQPCYDIPRDLQQSRDAAQSDSNIFSTAFFDAVAVRKNVNFSDRISIEKDVSEILIEKVTFSTA